MKQRIVRTVKGGLRRVKHVLAGNPAARGSLALGLPCTYNVDSPVRGRLERRRTTVEGWLIPEDGHEVRGLRLLHGGEYAPVSYGTVRADVARAFPDTPKDKTLHSGFFAELTVTDGPLSIEVDLGDGYKKTV